MAVYTKLSKEDIIFILSDYPIGNLIEFQGIQNSCSRFAKSSYDSFASFINMIFKALKTNFFNSSGTLKNKLKIEENSNYLQLKNYNLLY